MILKQIQNFIKKAERTTTMEKALQGMKILDFTRVYSGPYCTMLLADLGADVIKVEAVGKGDDTRHFAPIKNGQSGYYLYLNRSKKSITLDLKSEQGKKIALELAKWADVIIENFSPGTMQRLKLDYEEIKKVNPEVVYASISGFGQTGPYRNKVAYDAVAQAMGGWTNLTGFPGQVPARVGPAISDAATGVHTAVAILAAVYYKQATGKGQYIDIAMMDTVFSMLENAVSIKTLLGESPQRIGNSNPSSAPYNMYQTKDSYIVIATANDGLFTKLIHVMGQPDLIKEERFATNPARKANQKALDDIIENWTKQHTNAEIEAWLDEARVPVASLKSIDQLVEDPQIEVRQMLIEQDCPNVGKVKFPGNPIKLSQTPPDTSTRAPMLGEHTEEILKNILCYNDETIKSLKQKNII